MNKKKARKPSKEQSILLTAIRRFAQKELPADMSKSAIEERCRIAYRSVMNEFVNDPEWREEQTKPNALPKRAPLKYKDRLSNDVTPIEFLHQIWGRYLEAGLLHQHELRVLDESLLNAVRNYCNRQGLTSSDFVPTKSAKVQQKQEAAAALAASRAVHSRPSVRHRATA